MLNNHFLATFGSQQTQENGFLENKETVHMPPKSIHENDFQE